MSEGYMTNPITYKTALEIASHEALIRQAYKDSVGVWTWSVGLTSATGHDVLRYKDKPQSLEHCLAIYVWALDRYAEAVRTVFKGTVLTEAQFAAALSFHWNTGAITSASWVAHFKAGRLGQAETAFLSWNKPKEIIGRREKEADLLFRGKWSSNGTVNEYTRLTASYTPQWSSAVKTNIEAPLRAALGDRDPMAMPIADTHIQAPEPVAPNPSRTTADILNEVRSLLNELERVA